MSYARRGSDRTGVVQRAIEHPLASPGKRTLTEGLAVVHEAAHVVPQRGHAGGGAAASGDTAETDTARVHALATAGTAGSGGPLPYLAQIQRSFGAHDVRGVVAHTDAAAGQASIAMGATAFATGNHVAFAGTADLHTAAHEAAHVVQQRAGVHLLGGVGEAGDAHERHADEVAGAVARGDSAEHLLDAAPRGGGGSGAVQRFTEAEHMRMGNAAAGFASVELAPGYRVSHGEVTAMAADYFESLDELRAMAADTGTGPGTRSEVEYIRNAKLRGIKYTAPADIVEAVEERFYRLAANNRSHFPYPRKGDDGKPVADHAARARDPRDDGQLFGGIRMPPSPHSAIEGYRYYHLRAIIDAAEHGGRGTSVEAAMASEAFGDHYLTDSFSAGHVRTERTSIKQHWDSRLPMFFTNLKGWMAEKVTERLARESSLSEETILDPTARHGLPSDGARTIIGDALDAVGPLGMGDLVSGALHDYDNENGVQATSGGKDVTLFGDGKAGTGDEEQLAVKAAQLGIIEIHHAHKLGAAGCTPQQVIDELIGGDHLFAAERMIPVAKPDHQQGRDQAKIKWDYGAWESLLDDKRFAAAAQIFARDKASTMRGIVSGMSADKQKAVEEGVIKPLVANPIGTLRAIINWSPTILPSGPLDVMMYLARAAAVDGMRSLTYNARVRMIGYLMSVDQYTPVVALLDSASLGDSRKLIWYFGWDRLHEEIDGIGRDGPFKKRFPRQEYDGAYQPAP